MGKPVLLGTYAVDLAAMFFAFPNAILPFLADELDAVWALGLMYAAGAVGSLVLGLTSGWVSRVRRHGLLVVSGAAVWGLAVAAAGWSTGIWVVLLCLAVAGAGDMLSGLGRATIWNQTIPEELRGRLAGIEVLSYSVGPQLGQVRAGTMAGWTGTRPAVLERRPGLRGLGGAAGRAAAEADLLRRGHRRGRAAPHGPPGRRTRPRGRRAPRPDGP